MRELLRRIYYFLNRTRLQRELEHDMAVHREMLSPEQRKEFGNPAVLREHADAVWGLGWLERFLQDVRFGARILRRSPGLTATAVMVLALGIGVNVTAFSFVDAIFFRPLPIHDPYSLVRFSSIFKQGSSTDVAYPAAIFYRDHSSALQSVIAQMRTEMTLGEGATQSVHTALVTSNYFTDLGISASYGRTFDPKTDAASDASPTAMLGYGFFKSHFGADPSIVNKTIRINGQPTTVIGVVSSQFHGLDPDGADVNDVWLPIEKAKYFVPASKILSSFDQDDSGVRMYGRLKPGISLKAGEQALMPLAQELVQEHPEQMHEGEHLRAAAGGYAAEFQAQDLPGFGLLAAMTLLILFATGGNLGNLLLGHAVTREREIAIRLSLGATRARVLRQLITESFLLAGMGSAAALLLSWYAARAIVALILGRAGALDMTPDWRILVVCFALGLIACVIFGFPAARQLSAQRHRASRLRTFFIATQVCVSCVLLVLSGLLVRGLNRALKSDPGFDYKHVLVVDPQLYAHSYSASAALSYMHDLKDRLQQAPGVEAAALVRLAPLGNNIHIQRTKASDGNTFDVYMNNVDGDFFKTMGIPLLQGRTFKKGESDAAVVSESVARRLWPGKDPLQQVYDFGGKKLPVVGISANAHTMMLRNGNAGESYIPIGPTKLAESMVLVRTAQPPENFSTLATTLARSFDSHLGPDVSTLHRAYDDKVGDSAQIAGIVSGMGLLALLLAVIGLYGVVAYNVANRTREIGIRMALGATSSSVVRSMLTSFVLPLSLALSVGLALAAALSLILRNELYGVNHLDPFSYLAAALIMAGVGALASLLPARRALKVDPMVALRCE
jgi:predicted permease